MYLEIKASKKFADGRVIFIVANEVQKTDLDSIIKDLNKTIDTFYKNEMSKD